MDPYSLVIASKFDSIINDQEDNKQERGWKLVCDQQNRQDILTAAQLFYKRFPNNPKRGTVVFTDGPCEFGASQIECLNKESPAIAKMLDEGARIALSRDIFFDAINTASTSLEVAYYLNIPRLISGVERKILMDVDHWKNIGNYEAALSFFKEIKNSHLKNCSFYTRLIENELSALFGSILLLQSKNPQGFGMILDRYREEKISAISLSFETDAARACVNRVASIESLRIFKVDSFELKDSELSFPKYVTKVELKNISELTAETLKHLPITVTNLTLIGPKLSNDDLKFLPPSLTHLVLKGAFTGLAPVPFPKSLTYLELEKCFDFTDSWLQDLPPLQVLIVKNCPKITGKILRKAPNTLLHVEIIGSQVCDEDLNDLPDTLQTLIIPNSSLSNSAALPSHLTKLNISGSKITDEGLAKLSDKLAYLNASRCQVNGSGVKHLLSLTHLFLDHCPLDKKSISDIPQSVVHLSLEGVVVNDNDIARFPNRMMTVVLNGALLTTNGLLYLTRTITDVKIVGTKMLQEEAKKYLPQGCQVSF